MMPVIWENHEAEGVWYSIQHVTLLQISNQVAGCEDIPSAPRCQNEIIHGRLAATKVCIHRIFSPSALFFVVRQIFVIELQIGVRKSSSEVWIGEIASAISPEVKFPLCQPAVIISVKLQSDSHLFGAWLQMSVSQHFTKSTKESAEWENVLWMQTLVAASRSLMISL